MKLLECGRLETRRTNATPGKLLIIHTPLLYAVVQRLVWINYLWFNLAVMRNVVALCADRLLSVTLLASDELCSEQSADLHLALREFKNYVEGCVYFDFFLYKWVDCFVLKSSTPRFMQYQRSHTSAARALTHKHTLPFVRCKISSRQS